MKGKYYSSIIKVMIFIIDFWLINLAFIITRKSGISDSLTPTQYMSFFLIFALTWIIAGLYNKIYRIDTKSLLQSISINLLGAFAIHAVIITSVLVISSIYTISLPMLAYLYFVSAALIIGFRIAYKIILKYYQFSGFDQRKVVIIGIAGSGTALYQHFTNNEIAGYQFAGFFDDNKNQPEVLRNQIIGSLNADSIKDYCNTHDIGEIYYALPLSNKALLHEISKFADDHFIYFRIAPDFSEVASESLNVFLINSIPVLTTRKEPLGSSINANLKRAFDILFSTTVIITIFPVLVPIIALAIRLDSKGPIFFKQLRPGKKNKLFDCYKFRTMQVNNNGELQATKGDSRITRVGRILRKTNLDEFPQFFNVLLGNMSVVGPRPNMISQLDEYSKTIENYKVRHFVTPGITGYAQVNGCRGETKGLGLMEKRVQYDVQYIENWSLALDVKIIFLTVWNMVKGEKNAY
jgi:putative colanic acid biosynthesis UDP-glucose lipid carrier transferase